MDSETTTPSTFHWLMFPPELVEAIFSYLSASDLCAVSLACRRDHDLSSLQSLWRELYCHVWDICDPSPRYQNLGLSPPGRRKEIVPCSVFCFTYESETMVPLCRDTDWKMLFKQRYKTEISHCITFIKRERELYHKRKEKVKGNAHEAWQAEHGQEEEQNRPLCEEKGTAMVEGPQHAGEEISDKDEDMDKDYWTDRTQRKQMNAINRTMTALKYSVWGEILRDRVLSPSHPACSW